jgi:hypothetical protein
MIIFLLLVDGDNDGANMALKREGGGRIEAD